MSIFFITVISIVVILGSKKIFGKWFNPVSLYTIIWGVMLFLYELKLIAFFDLRTNTWLIIIASFTSFLLGVITILSSRSTAGKSNIVFETCEISPPIFLDNGKVLRYTIFFLSIIGLASALQHWQVLLSEYGSVFNVLVHSYTVYRSRLTGDEPAGIIPYVWLASYFAVFLAGIYTAYKRKLTLLSTVPLIAIVLKETARLTRAGILFGLFSFIISFVLTRHLLTKDRSKKFEFKKTKLILTVLIVISIMVSGAALVKIIRNPVEEFGGTSSSLNQVKGGAFISPAIYFYASSQVGVLNQYLEKNKENVNFGYSTFFGVYTILSKFHLVEKPKTQHKGYLIPQWSNTATFLREIHADFGFAGILLIPFLIGLLATFYWFKFFETHNFIYHVTLTHLLLIIAMSFFSLATRFPVWIYGWILFLFCIPIMEKIIKNKVID